MIKRYSVTCRLLASLALVFVATKFTLRSKISIESITLFSEIKFQRF